MDAATGTALNPCRNVAKAIFASRRDDEIEAVSSEDVGKRRADP
jgi:hypothetical protein